MWSPYDLSSNASSVPGYDRSAGDLHYPYGSAAHQYPPSLATEPSMFSDNQSMCNNLMQHPSTPAHPSYSMSFTPAHADFNPPNHNTVHYPSIGNNRPDQPSTMGYLSSGYSTARTTPSASGVSTPSMQEIPKPGVSRREVQTLFGGKRPLKRKHLQAFPLLDLHGTYQCNWKDCKYRGVFSRKGVLMRHIETQHVAPRSFDCPVCGHLFCRRDNMTEHIGRVHLKRS
ncbi:hypothetical protein N7517_004577 [Penicillium concentricum]|uniref:C2H2-type domain-containing protein n=1 Tax=Penicillium concentricum TaxID=293559 RepID=A0A9W9S5V8_9EURO|nr:uncharacterized protein N7517_004577 [Penicillium concentricum]KAJ5372571.1 hypothetical protein N7517_004577 [Penicillium concentricum]